jgi:hypothetical protein
MARPGRTLIPLRVPVREAQGWGSALGAWHLIDDKLAALACCCREKRRLQGMLCDVIREQAAAWERRN